MAFRLEEKNPEEGTTSYRGGQHKPTWSSIWRRNLTGYCPQAHTYTHNKPTTALLTHRRSWSSVSLNAHTLVPRSLTAGSVEKANCNEANQKQVPRPGTSYSQGNTYWTGTQVIFCLADSKTTLTPCIENSSCPIKLPQLSKYLHGGTSPATCIKTWTRTC